MNNKLLGDEISVQRDTIFPNSAKSVKINFRENLGKPRLFEILIFQIIFPVPREFEKSGFNCNLIVLGDTGMYIYDGLPGSER